MDSDCLNVGSSISIACIEVQREVLNEHIV